MQNLDSGFSAFALFCLAVIAVLFECCFAWMLWKLGRIDGDPVLREKRIWATWEYVNSTSFLSRKFLLGLVMVLGLGFTFGRGYAGNGLCR